MYSRRSYSIYFGHPYIYQKPNDGAKFYLQDVIGGNSTTSLRLSALPTTATSSNSYDMYKVCTHNGTDFRR